MGSFPTLMMSECDGVTRAELIEADRPYVWPEGIEVLDAPDVETRLLANAFTRRWHRDDQDIRILFYIAEGCGEIIDDEKQVGGYPLVEAPVRAPFVEAEWTLNMLEPRSGRYPGQAGPIQERLSPRDRAMRQ